jgi:predicted ATPase/DNA-binding SARP family transcriptional activator
VEFSMLGALEVTSHGGAITPPAPKHRALLGVLLLHPNEVVSRERLIDELWGERPPRSAPKVVQTYVSQLRRLLGPETIVTRAPGYELRIDEDAIDAARFRHRTAEARALAQRGDDKAAEVAYAEALALWRGPPLADVVFESFARNEIERLHEERFGALMEHIDCRLRLGQHEELIPELETMVRHYPLRERLHGQLMLALYRSGRQADALAAYQDARRILAEDLGLEPSRELQGLERAVLTHDATLESPKAPIASEKTNLPAQSLSFLGRERELGEVLALLRRDEVRLLTLTGPGGSGKTRLALAAAAEAAVNYDHGVSWVPLAALREPRLVLEEVARAVGAKDDPAREIGGRRLLLLLDNFEQVVAAAPGLAELLAACPKLNILVTSRQPLHLAGEHEYRVEPLGQDDAVALFRVRSGAVPDVGAGATVAEICRRLDCLPLAVELAAARAKVLPPEKLLERLEKRLPLLTRGPRDAPERHRAISATIAWSYDLLTSEEQRLFRRLSVFAGGSTIEAAEDVCAADLDLLQSLVEKNLLRAESGRLGMLETIREYALGLLDASGEHRDIADGHADYYLRFAVDIDARIRSAEQSQLLEELAREHENMRAALTWYLERGDERALHLVLALEHYWVVRDHLHEADRWFRSALLSPHEGASAVRAHALRQAGHIARNVGDESRERALFEESFEVAVAADSTADIAASLVTLDRQEEGLRLYRELGDERGAASALEFIGGSALRRGAFADARGPLEESLDIYRRLGVASHVAWVLDSLGHCALGEGTLAEAAALFREELVIARELHSDLAAADALAGLALVAKQRDDEEVADTLWRAAEDLAAAHGAPLRQRWTTARHSAARENEHHATRADLEETIAYALAHVV